MPRWPEPHRHRVLSEGGEAALRGALRAISPPGGFALMGGTALAEFYLGHRPSDDLDLFTLREGAVEEAARQFPAAMREEAPDASVRSEIQTPTFWRFTVDLPGGEAMDVDLIHDAPPRFGPVDSIEGVAVASLPDIAEGKLEAFVHRREPKDVIDVWALSALAGVELSSIYPLVFAKNPGLAAHPIAIAEALREAGAKLPFHPPLFVDPPEGELSRFFTEEYERFLDVELRRLP